MTIKINYGTNEQLWNLKKIAEENGYKKTADCYWAQIFTDENGNEIHTSREDEDTITENPADVLTRELNPETEVEEAEAVQQEEVVEHEEKKVFEFSTWISSEEWKEAEQKAIAAAKNHSGEKFTVAIGEWGSRTFLVLADSKEEAKALAVEYYNATNKTEEPADKVKVRNVTNCKKYN